MWLNPKDRPKITVGIDPDTKKSGVVIRYDLKDKSFEYKLMSFFQLYDRMHELAAKYGCEAIKVRIDAGWLNKKTNFHQKIKNKSGQWVDAPTKVKERISEKVGRNHETGNKIIEMCEHLKVPYELVKPTTAKWTPEILRAATGIETKNQELVDAFRLLL